VEQNTKENGKKIKKMVLVSSSTPITKNIKVIGLMDKKVVKVPITMHLEINILENG
jgi:hypothetical protein